MLGWNQQFWGLRLGSKTPCRIEYVSFASFAFHKTHGNECWPFGARQLCLLLERHHRGACACRCCGPLVPAAVCRHQPQALKAYAVSYLGVAHVSKNCLEYSMILWSQSNKKKGSTQGICSFTASAPWSGSPSPLSTRTLPVPTTVYPHRLSPV